MWESFSHDPRDPAHAGLRASDADRDVVHQLLAEAYADGRLDREEFDVRTGQVAAARTLGELPPVVEGLVPSDEPAVPAVRRSGALAPAAVEARAVEAWQADRRQAAWGFIAASTICWVIWLATGADGFAWPAIVSAATGLNVLRTQFQRRDIVEEHRRSIEKRERKALEKGSEEDDDS